MRPRSGLIITALGVLLLPVTASGGELVSEVTLRLGTSSMHSFASYYYYPSGGEFPARWEQYHVIVNGNVDKTTALPGNTWSNSLTSYVRPTPPNCYNARISIAIHGGVLAPGTSYFYDEAGQQCAQELSPEEACNDTCPFPCEGTPPVCPSTGSGGGTSGEGTGCYPWYNCSPLIFDLNGDGIHTTSTSNPVWFDLTGDGNLDHIAWTDPTSVDGFLWLDLVKNGRADDGTELFGVGTRLADGSRARHGFEALAEHDQQTMGGNGDGHITTEDRVWNHLRFWIDENHDGVCEASESGPIEQYGVVGIDLSYEIDRQPDENGNYHAFRSTFTRRVRGNGPPQTETFAVHDVFFQLVR